MNNTAAAAVSGFVFALGLGISGMTRPDKVVGFLDLTGSWDPSLAFVMLGAIAVHFVAYRLVPRMGSPLLGGRFGIPTRRDIDLRLVAGAVLFGAGWGIGGFCPGPALVSVTGGMPTAILFVVAMLGGMGLFEVGSRQLQRSAQAKSRAA
ncbi:MAG: putative membrane protein YedE/YeeE [Myxococcota bacterium]|jgi:uncharacterized membrane protein YedE/YeeE